ncbi:AHH domain-containing protein [Aliivibrio fischeri]|uniref:AHH domain-containing protein n=1 Tax=Aliivibrio fischeri TaxID=668 RepID=UPI0007C50E4F|nr:AHH domain-containing protein [Aliivibrio fischeri]MBP3140082.1 AHH domain-containing protein [Aliivibrio fischeri]MBP3154463.1 AHH domain-containing protein [Aliivibrio fischeri]MCE7572205.1 AHH domain-containing protein [Aliivibrio fischeri]
MSIIEKAISKEEIDFINGTVEKKGYRKRWISKVKKISNHPFNHGIHMDTHHLISAEAVTISGLGSLLEKKGYDINALNNLVGFPATLPGACQLHCQLHRGDHIFSQPKEEPYHKYVSTQIMDLIEDIKDCYGKTEKRETNHEIHSKIMDPMSNEILDEINDFDLPLTDIYLNFKDGNCGCADSGNITEARISKSICQNRMHIGIDYRYPDKGNTIKGNKKIITFNQQNWEPKVGQ